MKRSLLLSSLLALAPQARAVLSTHEREILSSSKQKLETYEGRNVILTWPKGFRPAWAPSLGVKDPAEFSKFLDRSYSILTRWFDYNPCEFFGAGKHNRLIFLVGKRKGKWFSDFAYPGWREDWRNRRAHIGMRNPTRAEVGSEAWLGWLIHEMCHDFLHVRHLGLDRGYGEGLCDFVRQALLKELRIDQEAAINRASYLENRYTSGYHGAAGALLDLYETEHYSSPREFFRQLGNLRLALVVGHPYWDFYGLNELSSYRLAYATSFARLFAREPMRDSADARRLERSVRAVTDSMPSLDLLRELDRFNGIVLSGRPLRYLNWENANSRLSAETLKHLLGHGPYQSRLPVSLRLLDLYIEASKKQDIRAWQQISGLAKLMAEEEISAALREEYARHVPALKALEEQIVRQYARDDFLPKYRSADFANFVKTPMDREKAIRYLASGLFPRRAVKTPASEAFVRSVVDFPDPLPFEHFLPWIDAILLGPKLVPRHDLLVARIKSDMESSPERGWAYLRRFQVLWKGRDIDDVSLTLSGKSYRELIDDLLTHIRPQGCRAAENLVHLLGHPKNSRSHQEIYARHFLRNQDLSPRCRKSLRGKINQIAHLASDLREQLLSWVGPGGE